ncbi:MAG: cytochrome c3 family protein [Anaerolineaceae bacterium]|nr:cytochrome c3 family protein [Anaerolineaceae bacterium]
MKRPFKLVIITGLLLVIGFILAACGQQAQTTNPPAGDTPAVEPTEQTCPETTPCPIQPDESNIPFYAAWAASGHADAQAEPFNHWNEEDPAEIPASCAKCHSSPGFIDFVGADGTAAGAVDANHAIGTVIGCETCHNEGTLQLTSVVFPSGAEVSGLGREAVCMSCHQGTASMVQVDEAIAAANVADEDTVAGDLGFTNIHYYAAAVSRYGTLVKGGYEYTDKEKTYDALWNHVSNVNSCTDCHEPHSTEVKVAVCADCHTGVESVDDVKDVRMLSSLVDYDGDGDLEEGIYYEVDGLRQLLYTAIQAYAAEVAGSPLVYDAATYPYYFIDTNADGQAGADEIVYANSYKSWTPRLAKAAYNYQTSIKDPGSYVHGGKYIMQLLYDSTEDLNEALSEPVDLSMAHRDDPGHFAGSEEAFRHWDADGMVPGSCAKCHSSSGLPTFLSQGVNVAEPASDGLTCETCHDNLQEFTRYQVELVTFPSGARLGFEDSPDDNLCLNCHQGRESTVSVNRRVQDKDPDTPDESLGFVNVHYFAAGSTLFGTEAKGIYEYPGKEYAGEFMHIEGFQTCTDCHDTHALQPKVDACQGCHQVDDPELIRMNSTGDYDGDGNTQEGLKGEIETLQEKLLVSLQTYASEVLGSPIAYDPLSHPYFFGDTNGNGVVDPEERTSDNSYKSWSPRLLEAAYNYQYAQKDPGAYVHNAVYVIQVLQDTISDLGTVVTVEPIGPRP